MSLSPLQEVRWLQLKGIALLVVLALLAGTMTQASSNLVIPPNLAVQANIPASPEALVSVPVRYTSGGNPINSVLFSIDFDQNWLSFNNADSNSDGIPDAVHLNVPAKFTTIFTYDATDTDGELDLVISDLAPNPSSPAVLPDGTLVTIDFTTGTPDVQQTAAVAFSSSPAPSFGDTGGHSVPGAWQSGSVIIPGKTNPYKSHLPVVPNGIVVPTLTPTPTNTPSDTPVPPVDPTRTVTPTVTKTQLPACPNLIANGGFEDSTAWVIPGTEYTAGYTTDRFHSGERSLRVGIIIPADNRYSYSSASQLVSIPQNAKSATLSYWLYASTTESASVPLSAPPSRVLPLSAAAMYDAQYVLVYDVDGNLLETLLWQRSNARTWQSFSHNLLKYAGQSVKLYFGAYNDGYGGVTGTYVDDVALTVCR